MQKEGFWARTAIWRAGESEGFGAGERRAAQDAGPVGVVGGGLTVGAVVGDAGGAVDEVEVGVLFERGGGPARAVQTQGRADAVDEITNGVESPQHVVAAGMVDEAAVAGGEGFVEFAAGLEAGVVDGGGGEEQVVDEDLLRIAEGAQGDAGAEGMGLDVEAVDDGAQGVDELPQMARGVVGGVPRDGKFRSPPAGPGEADEEAVVRRADGAGGFQAGLQFGVGAEDAGQRVAVAVDEEADVAIPGPGLELGGGEVPETAGSGVVAESQAGGEELVGAEVLAAAGEDHGGPPSNSVAQRRPGRQGEAARSLDILRPARMLPPLHRRRAFSSVG